MNIRTVCARQILDSRGNPTIEARVTLSCGIEAVASAPSGASTGSHEARVLVDGGNEYRGLSVHRAVAGICGEINDILHDMPVCSQRAIDEAMIHLDGTPDKSNFGANAMISVSMACAAAAAKACRMPLWRYLGGISGGRCPCPMMNVLNGGTHASNNVDIQECMLVPVGAPRFADGLRMCAETYHALGSTLREKGFSTSLGDEGGFAPSLSSEEEALDLLLLAIRRAGYEPGRDISLALDLAASEWIEGDHYLLPKRRQRRTRGELIAWYDEILRTYPVIALEDPLGEEDFEGFAGITSRTGDRVMIVGDDLFTTDPRRIIQGIRSRAANAVLLKPNQIGTVTETIEAVRTARSAGYRLVMSHRSGETDSTFISDFACAVNADFLKAGAPARGERVAKYNRVLAIEQGWA